jgi:hypothetical protein
MLMIEIAMSSPITPEGNTKETQLSKVYAWSSQNIHENTKQEQKLLDGYIPVFSKRFFYEKSDSLRNETKIFDLIITKSNSTLIGISGYHGIGKSAFIEHLFLDLNQKSEYNVNLLKLPGEIQGYAKGKNVNYHLIKEGCKNIVFIDPLFFNPKDVKQYLPKVMGIWEQTKKYKAIIVASIPPELSKESTFYNRFCYIDLRPLKNEQLIELYKLKWQTIEPFNEEALQTLARLSAGIIGRFMNFIKLCIEPKLLSNSQEIITIDQEKQIITRQIVEEYTLLDLSTFFKKKEQRIKAAQILYALRINNHMLNQTQIAEETNLSKATVGRLISELQGHWVNFSPAAHGQKLFYLESNN